MRSDLRFRITIGSIPLLLAGSAAAGSAQTAPSLEVAEAVITAAVEEHQPVDTLSAVSRDAGTVLFWTRITGAESEVRIEHVWYYQDHELARVPLRVASPNWRTWSSKKIAVDWTGEWRVDVVDADGTVLRSASFSVE